MSDPTTAAELFAWLPELEQAGQLLQAATLARLEQQAAADRLLPYAYEVQTVRLADAAEQGWPTSGSFRAWEGNGFAGPATVKTFDIWHQPCPCCDEVMLRLTKPGAAPFGRSVCLPCKADRKRSTDTARKRRQRAAAAPDPATTCAHCGETFTRKRSTAQFCSTRCRVAAHRQR